MVRARSAASERIASWAAGLAGLALSRFRSSSSAIPPMGDLAMHEGLSRSCGICMIRAGFPPGLYFVVAPQANQLFPLAALALSFVFPTDVACKLLVATIVIATPPLTARLLARLGRSSLARAARRADRLRMDVPLGARREPRGVRAPPLRAPGARTARAPPAGARRSRRDRRVHARSSSRTSRRRSSSRRSRPGIRAPPLVHVARASRSALGAGRCDARGARRRAMAASARSPRGEHAGDRDRRTAPSRSSGWRSCRGPSSEGSRAAGSRSSACWIAAVGGERDRLRQKGAERGRRLPLRTGAVASPLRRRSPRGSPSSTSCSRCRSAGRRSSRTASSPPRASVSCRLRGRATPLLGHRLAAVSPLVMLAVELPAFVAADAGYRALDRVIARSRRTSPSRSSISPRARPVTSPPSSAAAGRVLAERGGRMLFAMTDMPPNPVYVRRDLSWNEPVQRRRRRPLRLHARLRSDPLLLSSRTKRERVRSERSSLDALSPEADLLVQDGEWTLFRSRLTSSTSTRRIAPSPPPLPRPWAPASPGYAPLPQLEAGLRPAGDAPPRDEARPSLPWRA